MAHQLPARVRFRNLKLVCNCLGLLAALLSLSVQAGSLPSTMMPDGFGTNIHFIRGSEKDLDMIAAAGMRVVRTDIKWDLTERTLGVYDWSAYDELAENLTKRGLRPLFVLDYSNILYEEAESKLWMGLWLYWEVLSPRHPKSVAAFARWSAAAAQHFKKYNVIWEIWNEPNIKFWKPRPSVEEYTRLAMATCQSIRAVDPNATVIGPAASAFPMEFLEYLFKAGALNCLDGVSVHPYRFTVPETVPPDYARVRKLIDQYTPAGKSIPLLNGEWGYASLPYAFNLEDQAALAVRIQLVNMMSGIPLSIWYDWKNDGTDPRNGEHNFGTVFPDLSPKPAYGALKTMTAQLADYRFVERLNLSNSNDYALLFANAEGQHKIVAWTTMQPHNVRFAAPGPATKMSLTDGQGVRSEIALDKNWISLKLANQPAYLAP